MRQRCIERATYKLCRVSINHCSTGDRSLFHRRQVIARLFGFEGQASTVQKDKRPLCSCVTEVSMVMPCACAINTLTAYVCFAVFSA
ncbi:hypothetical protein HOLleu_22807 [Holothuria leucospilota]|uniref:Uncharacterized protein n=1 Tax=Holothuria leucospilota TaxID=206669 RepID=A0A9Q1BTV2_HOLLE|nr:hypothetical protein HOLleu_22807 [Holothuria leucospilota]